MPRIKVRLRTRLERERRAAKLTQNDLARLAKVNQATISKIENLKSMRPGVDVLASLAWALKRCGRRVELTDLQPKRQPVLVRGLLTQPRKRTGVA
jgi:transcriptional regulator with XRE-family HTH domain